MLEHLKIIDANPVLKEAVLTNLGRVNVLCGKNNSGKSTTLKAIEKGAIVGRTVTAETLKIPKYRPDLWVPKGATSRSGVNPSSAEEVSGIVGFWTKYDRIIEKIVSDQKIWFYDEIASVEELVEQQARKSRGKYLFENVDFDFRDCFGRLFLGGGRRVLIPPKREVGARTNYSAEKQPEVEPSGKRLLSRLSWDKNQPKQSEDFKLYQRILSSFEEITGGHSFNLTQGLNTELILRFSFQDHDEIEAESCGLGLQDLLVILFFALSDDYNIILIEEPENHMHPEMQKKLLKFLKEKTEKQYFISTHSNLFLNNTYVDKVFFTEFTSGQISVRDVTSRAEALHSLGYSVTDNLVSDLILLVEGSGDKIFVEQFLAKMGLDAKYRINIWILGGNEMANQDLSSFGENYKVLALVDRDDESKVARDAFSVACKEYKIPLHILNRYSLESYFSLRGLNGAFNAYSPKLHEILNLTDSSYRRLVGSRPVWDAVTSQDARRKQVKKMLKKNVLSISQKMNVEDIDGTDLAQFFVKVRETLTTT